MTRSFREGTGTEETSVVFLGINDAGWKIYEWLCDRDGVSVQALVTTREQLGIVASFEPEYLVSVGYRHIVPEEILAIPSGGCLNLHPALLPYNRGTMPNVWGIVEDTPAGVTLHHMDASIDTGDIIRQRTVDTSFADTGKALHERLERAQFSLFVETWPDIEQGDIDPTSQNDRGTYHTTAEFDDLCEIDPEQEYTAQELLDVLRALTFPPYDNASIEIDGETYYIEVDITPAHDAD